MNLSDGQMYQNQLDAYLDLLENQIKAYRCSKAVDHQGLTENNLESLRLACEFIKMIIDAIEKDCDIRDKYYEYKENEN